MLHASGISFVATDLEPTDANVVPVDLKIRKQVADLFQRQAVRGVIHLAGILPSAFHSDPLMAVDLNLSASFELMRQALKARVSRFVFASSMSVYGLLFDPRPRIEEDVAVPGDPYGAGKRAVELVGESLLQASRIEFVSLRIARAIGPGTRKTSSPWRAEIFERSDTSIPIRIPFSADAMLSLVHVNDIARMLITLANAANLRFSVYNTPADLWKVGDLKNLVEESRGVRVELGPSDAHGGPLCDGSRFANEFGFRLRGLRERLVSV